MTSNSQNYLVNFTDDLIRNILLYVSIRDLSHFTCSQKRFSIYMGDKILWKKIYEKINLFDVKLDSKFDLKNFNKKNVYFIITKQKLDQMNASEFIEYINQTNYDVLTRSFKEKHGKLFEYVLKRINSIKGLNTELIFQNTTPSQQRRTNNLLQILSEDICPSDQKELKSKTLLKDIIYYKENIYNLFSNSLKVNINSSCQYNVKSYISKLNFENFENKDRFKFVQILCNNGYFEEISDELIILTLFDAAVKGNMEFVKMLNESRSFRKFSSKDQEKVVEIAKVHSHTQFIDLFLKWQNTTLLDLIIENTASI